MAKPIPYLRPPFSIAIGLFFCVAGPIAASSFSGAEVSGIARQFEITCGTCPNPVTILSSTADGGVGRTSAAVSFENLGRASYLATATLNGPNSLPSLGAFAAAGIVVDTVNLTTFFHNAVANAKGTQQYFYTGSAPETYTLTYILDGLVIGGPLSQLFGGFSVFGGTFDPQQEIQPVLGTSSESVHGIVGTTQTVSLTGSVTFDIAPGDSFYVVAQMFATADSRNQVEAFVDAANTLGLSFTAGNTSLLTPVAVPPAAAVPEPAAAALSGMGLLLAGLFKLCCVKSSKRNP